MKAFEFFSRINPGETLLVPEAEEDADWARLTAEQFLQGYDERDAIYDDLPGR